MNIKKILLCIIGYYLVFSPFVFIFGEFNLINLMKVQLTIITLLFVLTLGFSLYVFIKDGSFNKMIEWYKEE